MRRRALLFGSALVTALAIASFAVVRNRIDAAKRETEQSLIDRDMGRFTIELAPVDWDPGSLKAIPVAATELPELAWELHYPDEADPGSPGKVFDRRHVARKAKSPGDTFRQLVEARGGKALLVVRGRGTGNARCTSSIIPVLLPGFAERPTNRVLRILVPTCDASRAGTIAIAPGPFIYGGVGEPPVPAAAEDPLITIEDRIVLPGFSIDRTEVTNAAFTPFAEMAAVTGIKFPSYPVSVGIGNPAAPLHPVTYVTWNDARAYCRWLGKRLPTSHEWVRALRGGESLGDGSPNPYPRRNFPWGDDRRPPPARIYDAENPGVTPVGTHPEDRSPDGVLDLAGNACEWTNTNDGMEDEFRFIRGAGAFVTDSYETLLNMTGVENPRPIAFQYLDLGLRCVYVED